MKIKTCISPIKWAKITKTASDSKAMASTAPHSKQVGQHAKMQWLFQHPVQIKKSKEGRGLDGNSTVQGLPGWTI